MHPEEVVRYREIMPFRGIDVEFDKVLYHCIVTDEYFASGDMLNANERSLKEAYRRKCGLMTAEEITELRKSYGISQTDLCILLGWGEKTVTRYEGPQIQDRAHDLILKKIKEDPEWFIELLEASRSKFSERAYNKYLSNARKLYSKAYKQYANKAERALAI
jgi:putative zinc finger/helix-turn-helix YgiT family protein